MRKRKRSCSWDEWRLPEVQKRADNHFEVFATATSPALVIRLRGNEVLIADLLRKTNWNSLLELMR